MTSIGPKSLLRSLEMALSDLTVRQARTTGKRYTLSDNDCLGVGANSKLTTCAN